MSVVSRNPFDLLGDSEDFETVVKEKESLVKETAVPQKKVDRSRAQPKEARIRFEYPQRGGHKAPASNRNEDTRSAPRDRNVGPRLSGRRDEGGSGGGGDYPTRSSRGARPGDRGRGNRGSGRGRGREYDRHSGTGKHDSEKKENQGWGSATDTWENNGTTDTSSPGWGTETNSNSNTTWQDNTNDTNADSSWGGNNNTTGDSWNTGEKSGANDNWNSTEETKTTDNNSWTQQPVEPSTNWDGGDEGKTDSNWENKTEVKKEDTAAGDSVQAPEPEEAVKTYDEYLAEKAQKSLDISLPESRKANEGADDSQWKDTVPLEKDEEDDFLFVGKEQHFRNKSKKSKTKNFLEITQTFEKSGGGPRGRGRGRGGRGGNRGRDDRDRDGRSNYRDRDNYDDNNRDNNRDNRRRGGGGGGRGVNLDDQRAFPSLGA